MSKKKPAAKQPEAVVYCGPTIPGVAKQFTTYTGGIPDALATASGENPILQALIVPLEQLSDARQQLAQRSGPIYNLYQQMQK